MTKVLVFNDGYHDKEVVIADKNGKNTIKYSFNYFINNYLVKPHTDEYEIKTLYYEDIVSETMGKVFDFLYRQKFCEALSTECDTFFSILWECDDAVEGCDVY